MAIELHVGREHGNKGCIRRFLGVARKHVTDNSRSSVFRTRQHDAHWLGVRHRWTPLDEVVNGGHLLVGHRFIGELLCGMRLAEEQILRVGVEGEQVSSHRNSESVGEQTLTLSANYSSPYFGIAPEKECS